MKDRSNKGQAFLLVLVLLAIGAALTIQALRLTQTSLKSTEIVTNQTRMMYACDAAQEYIAWQLGHNNYGANFTQDGQEDHLVCNVCGIPVDITVIMRAVPGTGGVTLAGDDVIKPTVTVTPEEIPWSYHQEYEYTIRLEQLSDNTSQGLEAVYNILPKEFATGVYVWGSSKLRVDGGEWVDFEDPLADADAGNTWLRWPAEGIFESPMKDFLPRQVKEIKFKVADKLGDDDTYCDWVLLKPWNTISGPQAPIKVGDGPDECESFTVLEVTKASDPEIIRPGIIAEIEYTVSIRNLYNQVRNIEYIVDILPPEFYYVGPIEGDINEAPSTELKMVNGVEREVLTWTQDEFPGDLTLKMLSGEIKTFTFKAKTTKNVSGSYYNEVFADLVETGIPGVFEALGLTKEEYASNYSWNTGTVVVPTFDSEAEAGGIVLDANMMLIKDGAKITSYQFR